MEVEQNKYGFRWGDVLVERAASNEKIKLQTIRIHTPTGEVVEVTMCPSSTKVNVFT